MSKEIGWFSRAVELSRGIFIKKKIKSFVKLDYMEAADFTGSILKEIFRRHVLVSKSSHLEVFSENYAADFFLKHYLRFKIIHLKIPVDVVFIF